jgi:hypothetical protein
VKLLFIAGGFASPGGTEPFIHDLSPILVSRGHNVSLLCWGPRSPLLDEIARGGVDVRRQPFQWARRAVVPDFILLIRRILHSIPLPVATSWLCQPNAAETSPDELTILVPIDVRKREAASPIREYRNPLLGRC